MKRIFPLILVITMLLTVQVVPVSADNNTTASYTLTAEDERRLMEDYEQWQGTYYITNEEYKAKVKEINEDLMVAKEYMELRENYDYTKLATSVGKEEYKEGFLRYLIKNYTGSTANYEKQADYILKNKLIKESTFVTSDNCIFLSGDLFTIVRGVEYFTIISKDKNALPGIKTGVKYKRDLEVELSSVWGKTDWEYTVTGFHYFSEPKEVSDPTAVTPSAPTYSASPTSSKVLVNGKAVNFEAYNINGSNYFKLRDLAMAINGTEKQFEVGWDGAKNAINLTTNMAYTAAGGELVVSANPSVKEAKPTTSKIYLDGQEVSFTAYTINGNNYFKLRDVGKAINFGITWDGKTNTIGMDTSTIYTE